MPRQARPAESRDIAAEKIWLVLLPLLAAAAGAWVHFGSVAPKCVFKGLTGIPCLTCGMGRGTTKLFEGDFVAAFLLNPLNLVLPAAAVAGWLYCAAAVAGFAKPFRLRNLSPRNAALLRAVAVLFLAANWLYLLFLGGS